MSRVIHLALDIEGALRHPQELINCITWEGRKLTTKQEVKTFLEYQLAMGRQVLPCSDECEGFDYITGCPGHEVTEQAPCTS